MGKGLKSNAFKDKAKNHLDDVQNKFIALQSARKEGRSTDVAMLEEQVNQMLREWQTELNEPSPASSLQQGGSLGSFSIGSIGFNELMQHLEEEDDATSSLAGPKPEPVAQKVAHESATQEGFHTSNGPHDHGFGIVNHCKSSSGINNMHTDNISSGQQFDYHSFDISQDFDYQFLNGFDGTTMVGEDGMHDILASEQNTPPPPYAFLGPKCALWDCSRPAMSLDWSQKSDDYCSSNHARVAPTEGSLGTRPVVRPTGIGLKDPLLLAALVAKAQGKEVGIPECEGAATSKSPWNASELFDIELLEKETIREWLFFDKPRRAFESGNRKQRSLPDYKGRGWHESRKIPMTEHGGLKRSYYMDPQPEENREWHLFEYELNNYDTYALYRLEIKLSDGKKAAKGKISKDPLADLQKRMGQLTAEVPTNQQKPVKGKGKANMMNVTTNIGGGETNGFINNGFSNMT